MWKTSASGTSSSARAANVGGSERTVWTNPIVGAAVTAADASGAGAYRPRDCVEAPSVQASPLRLDLALRLPQAIPSLVQTRVTSGCRRGRWIDGRGARP